MKKIKLDQPIKDIQGRNLTTTDTKGKRKNATLRDYLLLRLGSKFEILQEKEYFWTYDLGIKIADPKNKEIELSEDQVEFLKRIIKNNKAKIVKNTPMGPQEEESYLFSPYEVGQILKLLS